MTNKMKWLIKVQIKQIKLMDKNKLMKSFKKNRMSAMKILVFMGKSLTNKICSLTKMKKWAMTLNSEI